MAATLPAESRYPSHWWKPVSKEQAASWEVLPQEARPGEVILSKRNELGLLSNFAATPFTLDGERYASLEGFWQWKRIRRCDACCSPQATSSCVPITINPPTRPPRGITSTSTWSFGRNCRAKRRNRIDVPRSNRNAAFGMGSRLDWPFNGQIVFPAMGQRRASTRSRLNNTVRRRGELVAVKRLDNVGIVVEDLDGAIAFFLNLASSSRGAPLSKEIGRMA